MPLIGSVMILADLQEGNRFWNNETRTYSLTSGPRSPTKMECSGPRSSRLDILSFFNDQVGWWDTHVRSARPPPEAQLSLNGRLVLGIGLPFNCSAFAAAAELVKSMKQYPALLLQSVRIGRSLLDRGGGRPYPENLSRIILTLTCSPKLYHTLRTKFSSIHGSSSPILEHESADGQNGAGQGLKEFGRSKSRWFGRGHTEMQVLEGANSRDDTYHKVVLLSLPWG